eukprot:SAG22_NODE_14233_length_381_cov_0.553191_1_plen_111_part_01
MEWAGGVAAEAVRAALPACDGSGGAPSQPDSGLGLSPSSSAAVRAAAELPSCRASPRAIIACRPAVHRSVAAQRERETVYEGCPGEGVAAPWAAGRLAAACQAPTLSLATR